MNILDRSKTYLSIFNEPVKVDKNLPKWKIISESTKNQIKNSEYNLEQRVSQPILNLNNLLNFNSKDFNIYLGRNIVNTFNHTYNIDDSVGSWVIDDISEKKDVSLFKKVVQKFKKYLNRNDIVESEEKYELNILEFFNQVKVLAKENQSQYALRIKPYMIALKEASEMGQQALADILAAEIFNNKYESILYAEGFHYKIKEEQLVAFVKKTEKGVKLDYISNFIRPIPKEVIEKKKKADSLLVFDNYCVLYYDPESKSYSQTQKEKEEERKKKADPILFGLISGSRNLYYITDWIDEFCDLTLDEFIKVSGLDKKDIKIDEEIQLIKS